MMKPYSVPTRSIFLLLYLIPFLFLLWLVGTFGVNIPYWDQWELVKLFDAIATGHANIQVFFEQHNEHRILFPKLIIAALAFGSGWNTKFELLANIVLATLTFVLICQLAFGQAAAPDKHVLLSSIFTSFIIFSTMQWENWLWGFQIAWFLVDACLVVAIAILSSSIRSPRTKMALAALACFVASFSSAHGLLTWLAVIPSFATLAKTGRALMQQILAWLILFVVCLGLYLIDYHKPSQHPDLLFFLTHPVEAADYFLTLLGSPLLYQSNIAALFGALLFLNFGYFFNRFLTRSSPLASRQAAPWISLGTFAVLFDAMTTVGRAGFGISQALSPRYTTVAILLLIALLQLWRLALTDTHLARLSIKPNRTALSPKYMAIGSVLTLLVLVASINSLPAARAFQERLSYGKACLSAAALTQFSSDQCLALLYPDTKLLMERAQTLDRIGLRRFPSNVTFSTDASGVYGQIDPLTPTTALIRRGCVNCGTVDLHGWAILPNAANQPHLVLLTNGSANQILTTAYVGLDSPDVVAAMKSSRYTKARWLAKISPETLPSGNSTITAWVYDRQANQMMKLGGDLAITVKD